jgi:hypothetical protein
VFFEDGQHVLQTRHRGGAIGKQAEFVVAHLRQSCQVKAEVAGGAFGQCACMGQEVGLDTLRAAV